MILSSFLTSQFLTSLNTDPKSKAAPLASPTGRPTSSVSGPNAEVSGITVLLRFARGLGFGFLGRAIRLRRRPASRQATRRVGSLTAAAQQQGVHEQQDTLHASGSSSRLAPPTRRT